MRQFFEFKVHMIINHIYDILVIKNSKVNVDNTTHTDEQSKKL